MPLFISTIQTPVGPLTIKSDSQELLGISYNSSSRKQDSSSVPPPIKECIKQLNEYFNKQRSTFRLNLKLTGTPFQKKVWKALQDIPYGKTVSYSQIASLIDAPKACRAVGSANNANPFSIVIPCHRVVGIKNDLVGYAAGLKKKSLLLRHEGFSIKNFKIQEQ